MGEAQFWNQSDQVGAWVDRCLAVVLGATVLIPVDLVCGVSGHIWS